MDYIFSGTYKFCAVFSIVCERRNFLAIYDEVSFSFCESSVLKRDGNLVLLSL